MRRLDDVGQGLLHDSLADRVELGNDVHELRERQEPVHAESAAYNVVRADAIERMHQARSCILHHTLPRGSTKHFK